MSLSSRMRVCTECRTYALHDGCPKCGAKTKSPHPARFSPQDPYGKYRRQLKRLEHAKAEAAREARS